MMDIENIWQRSGGSDDALNKVLQQKDFSNLPSKLPLQKLKKNLLIGLILAILITAIYVVLIYFISIWQVQLALVIAILFNSWVGFDTWKLYINIKVNVSTTNSLKDELQKNYSGFQKWWRIQERLGLFVYPIAATGGFILGGVEGSGKAVEAFLYNPKMLIVLGVTLLILVPVCYYGARWMFNFAYGKHLKKLKQLIDELSD
jgi:hypothetical protein